MIKSEIVYAYALSEMYSSEMWLSKKCCRKKSRDLHRGVVRKCCHGCIEGFCVDTIKASLLKSMRMGEGVRNGPKLRDVIYGRLQRGLCQKVHNPELMKPVFLSLPNFYLLYAISGRNLLILLFCIQFFIRVTQIESGNLKSVFTFQSLSGKDEKNLKVSLIIITI